MKRTLIILGLIVTSLWLAACGGGPQNPSGYPSSVLFLETWESYPVGDFPGGGWVDTRRPYVEKMIEFPDNHKMLMLGPIGEPRGDIGGIFYRFKPGSMLPTYIRYNIHPYIVVTQPGSTYPPYRQTGNFLIRGNLDNLSDVTATGVMFQYDGNGNGYLISSSGASYPGSDMTDKIPIDNSFLVEIKNINWENSQNITFDFWVNGNEVESCLSFTHPIESITSIRFYNNVYGKFHFDNIYMANLPIEYNCPVVSENPPGPDTMPLPPQPSPTRPTDPVIFIIDIPAFCREGPGTEYPKLSTYPEGTQLEITGQNIEGSWWWSEGAGCWIADTVGELVGDFRTLDIIIPPPPPDTDPSDGSSGKPAGCNKSLGQAACLEEGGTWDDQPGQPGTCICP